MSKAQYDIYRQKILELTKTLVVKNRHTAAAINRELGGIGHTVNESDQHSWKYYKHLAGIYHETDVPMEVTSLDTLETIPFTRTSLRDHLATAREYALGGTYYKALVSKYPDQEDLIRGILTPVDIDTAIAAEDGQILYYDKTLVEENEENLIPRLEWWCKVFNRRWFNAAYTQSDELYLPAHIAQMYMFIPAVIANIRLANCHTNYAHSYHIRSYLASHGKLDWSVDYLTKKQMLWLYRNIRYIERNAGKRQTFDVLVKNIMTDRNLPLAEWAMRHSLEHMPDEILPRPEFVRRTLNVDLSLAGDETRNVTQMLEAELVAAKGNERVLEDQIPIVRRQLEYSLDDRLATKVLESAVLDLTDASFFTLADALLNHWLYLSHIGTYTAVITIDNPRTGAPLTLSVKEAFIVYLYAYAKSIGIETEYLPVLQANNVRRRTPPRRPEIEGLIQTDLRDEYVMEALFRGVYPIPNHISTEAFHRDVSGIHKKMLEHRYVWATREDSRERGQVEAAAMRFYHDWTCDLGQTERYETWFRDRGLDMMEFTRLESALLAEQLLEYATGANLNDTLSLREIQTAMLRLMRQLSSYSVQYLQSINVQTIIVPDTPHPRIGKQTLSGGDTFKVNTVSTRVKDLLARGKESFEVVSYGQIEDYDARLHETTSVGTHLNSEPHIRPKYSIRVEMARPSVMGVIEPTFNLDDVIVPDTDHYIPIGRLPFRDAFQNLNSPHYQLDAEDKQTLLDRWNDRPNRVEPIVLDIDDLIPAPDVVVVDGLTPPDVVVSGDSIEMPEVGLRLSDLTPAPDVVDTNHLTLPDVVVLGDAITTSAVNINLSDLEPAPEVVETDHLTIPDVTVLGEAITIPEIGLRLTDLSAAPTVTDVDGLSLPDVVISGDAIQAASVNVNLSDLEPAPDVVETTGLTPPAGGI